MAVLKEKLSGFHVMLLVFMYEFGVVVFSLPHLLATYFGTNGYWVILPVTLFSTLNILLYQLVYRLGKGTSIFIIMEQRVPKWVLLPFYVGFAAVWGIVGNLVMKEYVLIFQMLAFPTVNPMLLKLVLDFLTFLLVAKGIYNISKAATISFWASIWLVFVFVYFTHEFEWTRLTPYLFRENGFKTEGLSQISTAFIGYEITLLLFPYITKKTKIVLSTILGNWILAFIYFESSFVAYGYYGYLMLKQMRFPLLELLASVEMPFIERIENLFYSLFLFSMVITSAVYTWAATETMKRVFPAVKMNVLSFFILAGCYLVSFIPDVLTDVMSWLDIVTKIEIGIAAGLPLVLLALLLFRPMKDGERAVNE